MINYQLVNQQILLNTIIWIFVLSSMFQIMLLYKVMIQKQLIPFYLALYNTIIIHLSIVALYTIIENKVLYFIFENIMQLFFVLIIVQTTLLRCPIWLQQLENKIKDFFY
jgi:hypothetical protein